MPILSEARHDSGTFKALPPTDVDEVVGLCEVVQEHGGCVDFYDLAREFGHIRLLPVAVEGAKMLGLVKTRGGEVMLTPFGRTWIKGNPEERRRLFYNQMSGLELTRWLCGLMRDSEGSAISEEYLLREISAVLPTEDAQSTFWTLVNWGSYAQLFTYHEDQRALVLRSHHS